MSSYEVDKSRRISFAFLKTSDHVGMLYKGDFLSNHVIFSLSALLKPRASDHECMIVFS